MAKQKSNAGKSTAKATKKAKALQKVEKKVTKKSSKSSSKEKEKVEDCEDLERILDELRKEWEAAHTVTEELVEGSPSRRANATLTACPNGNHLWFIGGEFFSEDGKAYFYNDVFRYTPEKEEWRKFVSQTCPGPRSAHAVVATSAGGGKIFLFGGEFSSLYQNNFHHYRDFWCFDISTHSWDRIETKVRPGARSGHRMAFFKHYVVLFGGFYDPGITTRYLNDLWVFDIQEYKWRQIEFKETDPRPSPRSGFSFLSSADGILLHGGYCKEYEKGKRPIGVMLEDTWFLHMSLHTPSDSSLSPSLNKSNKSAAADPLTVKWERRKRGSYAPSIRSGCTMALWTAKDMGIMFGGVTDEDKHEETLESVFWNDMYGYQIPGKGRWVSLMLKQPKKPRRPAGRKQKVKCEMQGSNEAEDGVEIEHSEESFQLVSEAKKPDAEVSNYQTAVESRTGPDDTSLTTPMSRYNAMLAVLRNTLYIYGGIFERGSREYTLDDFYSIQLDKMDRFVCLKKSEILIDEGGESSSESDEDDDSEGEDDNREELEEEDNTVAEDKEEGGEGNAGVEKLGEVRAAAGESVVDQQEQAHQNKVDLRSKASAFIGVSKDTTRSQEDIISTPSPGETLAMFYARSREYWANKAHATSDNRGKQLRRDGFALAEERYASYKPILEEVEKVLAEAGLDEEEMKRTMATAIRDPLHHPLASTGGVQNRNRR